MDDLEFEDIVQHGESNEYENVVNMPFMPLQPPMRIWFTRGGNGQNHSVTVGNKHYYRILHYELGFTWILLDPHHDDATDEIAILREALERIAKLRETGVVMEDGRKAEAYLSDAEAVARGALKRIEGERHD